MHNGISERHLDGLDERIEVEKVHQIEQINQSPV
jgi:hypothetical protein